MKREAEPVASNEAARPRSGRPTAAEAARRRALLLQSAVDEFVAHGFERANLGEIAARCGISKTTIYRQYGSKIGMFIAAAEYAVESLTLEFQHIVDAGDPPEQVLKGVIARHAAATTQTQELLRLAIAEAPAFPAVSEALVGRALQISRPVADYLRALSADPMLSEEAAMRHALMLMSLATGGFLRLLGYDRTGDVAWQDQALELFLRGFPIRGDG